MAAVGHDRPKAPLIYNPAVRGVAYQVLLCLLIAFLAWSAIDNAAIATSKINGNIICVIVIANAIFSGVKPLTKYGKT